MSPCEGLTARLMRKEPMDGSVSHHSLYVSWAGRSGLGAMKPRAEERCADKTDREDGADDDDATTRDTIDPFCTPWKARSQQHVFPVAVVNVTRKRREALRYLVRRDTHADASLRSASAVFNSLCA